MRNYISIRQAADSNGDLRKMEWPDRAIAFYWKNEEGQYGRRTVETIVRTTLVQTGAKILEDEHFIGNGLVNLRSQLDEWLTNIILYSFYELQKNIDISFIDESRNLDSKIKNIYIRLFSRRRMVLIKIEDIEQKFTVDGPEGAQNIARRAIERIFQSLSPARSR